MRGSSVPTAVIVLAVLLVGVLAYGVFGKNAGQTLDAAVQRGERPAAPAADVRLPRLGGGGALSIGDFKGQIVAVNIWASWCPPCEDEAPLLAELHDALQDSGEGSVLGATHLDATDDSLRFEREFDLPFPSVRDVDDKLYKAFGATGPPETFVIDREGRVAAVARGGVSREFVRDALRAAGAKAQLPEKAPAEEGA